MKQRLRVGLSCYVVLPGGILRGSVVASMKKGKYSVRTFLGNVTVSEPKIFELGKFMEACKVYENWYGAK
jgi:hypothetical protein